ncbi:hypothetical protein [Streptomyces sp. JNUCC 63]
MEFVDKIMSWTAEGDTVRLPSTPVQPVAADEAVQALADVAVEEPLKGTLNVVGPDVFPLDELGRLTLRARPAGGRKVVTDHTAPAGARLGTVHYTDWLTGQSAGDTPGPA